MEFLKQLQIALIMAMTCMFVQATKRLDKSYNVNIATRKLRAKRHVVFDNTKLCKAVGCVNGFCKESELKKYRIVCECFTGYEGTLCDKLKCPYDCGTHGTCARKGSILYCKCNEGYFGARCDSLAQNQSKPSPKVGSSSMLKAIGSVLLGSANVYETPNAIKTARKNWFANTASPKHVKFSEFHSHAEIDKSVKPDVCVPGFQCYHGHCDRESMAYGLFQCLCKPNYTGLFCEKRCTLKCKNGGSCIVLNDGHQLCSCPFNFTGHYCEKAA
jgi:hypothetical protein